VGVLDISAVLGEDVLVVVAGLAVVLVVDEKVALVVVVTEALQKTGVVVM
jgi:hypothetical protein